MANETKIKIKNDEPTGASLRLQFWNGKLPTYDTDANKAAALAAHAVSVEGEREVKAPADVETLPENFGKLKKAELVELAATRGVTVEEADTVATLKEKIEATYPVVEDQGDAAPKVAAQNKAAAASVPDYEFSAANLLQEATLAVGEEKVFGLTTEHFITIKIDA